MSSEDEGYSTAKEADVTTQMDKLAITIDKPEHKDDEDCVRSKRNSRRAQRRKKPVHKTVDVEDVALLIQETEMEVENKAKPKVIKPMRFLPKKGKHKKILYVGLFHVFNGPFGLGKPIPYYGLKRETDIKSLFVDINSRGWYKFIFMLKRLLIVKHIQLKCSMMEMCGEYYPNDSFSRIRNGWRCNQSNQTRTLGGVRIIIQ